MDDDLAKRVKEYLETERAKKTLASFSQKEIDGWKAACERHSSLPKKMRREINRLYNGSNNRKEPPDLEAYNRAIDLVSSRHKVH